MAVDLDASREPLDRELAGRRNSSPPGLVGGIPADGVLSPDLKGRSLTEVRRRDLTTDLGMTEESVSEGRHTGRPGHTRWKGARAMSAAIEAIRHWCLRGDLYSPSRTADYTSPGGGVAAES